MTCTGWGACLSMVCLSLSLSAARELKADFSEEWTGGKEIETKRAITELSWKPPHHTDDIQRNERKVFSSSPDQSRWELKKDSLLLASLQKSSWRRLASVGESGESGHTSWVLDSVVERLGLEAWRRVELEEMQLGTCGTERDT